VPEKGWLKIVLEQATKDVSSRPDWQRNRVYGTKQETSKPAPSQVNLPAKDR